MSGEADPFELLRQANPVDAETLPGPDSSEAQAQLARILSQPRPERSLRGRLPGGRLRGRLPGGRPHGRRRRLPYLVPVVAALVVGAGAAAWALTRGASRPLTIGCYAAPSLNADTAVIAADRRSPTDACQALWQQGALGPAQPGELQACILASGAIGVFPNRRGGDVCKQLALAPAGTAQPPPADRIVELKDRLVDRFLAAGCLSEQDAKAIVREQLDRLNLRTWTVRPTASFTAARPCATLGFDTEAHAVLLIPAPRS